MKSLASLLTASLLLWQSNAFALGLGTPATTSLIGTRLVVQVPLIGMGDMSDSDIKATTADKATYDKMHIEPSRLDTSLRFSVVRKDGQPFLEIKSTNSISEPYVQFVIKVTSPQGVVFKDIALLLDTPKQ